MTPLDRAITAAGSATALAQRLGLRWVSTVTNWRVRGVPPKRCADIEDATGGLVTREQLRPDVFRKETN